MLTCHSHSCGCDGCEARPWHPAQAQGSKGNRWTDNGRVSSPVVSSNCHFRTGAEQNRKDGFQIPDSSQSVSLAFVSGRCLQIAGRSERRAKVWIINHNGTINTLFSQVRLILKMSKADGTLPAAENFGVERRERGETGEERMKQEREARFENKSRSFFSFLAKEVKGWTKL